MPHHLLAFACAALLAAASPHVPEAFAPTPAQAATNERPPRLDPAWGEHVAVGEVAAAPAGDWLQVPARLAYDDEHTQHVTAAIAGRVARVLVTPGQAVRAGEPLLTLVSPEAAQLRAEMHKAREDLTSAHNAHRRAEGLLHDGATSAREAAEAAAMYRKAEADFARADAHLSALGLQLSGLGTHATLLARQSGVVTARNVFAGQELRADAGGEPLLTISDLSQVWLLADVYEQDLARVTPHARVRARVPAWPGSEFVGEVAHVGDVVDAQSRAVQVRCVLRNPERRLKPHMLATAWLQTAPGAAVQVPSTAVVHEVERAFVVAVDADDVLTLRPVVLGPLRDGSYPVVQGLQLGERVVVRGALFVAEAMRGR